MTLPITGPFTKVQSLMQSNPGLGFSSKTWERSRVWYRQRKPHNLPLIYTFHDKHVYFRYFSSPNARDITSCPPYDVNYTTSTTNRAYAKMVDNIGDASQWATNLFEYRQSISLIEETATKLYRFSRSLKRLDFRAAAKILKTEVPDGLVRKAKSFGNNYLKFHFAVEPMIKDIHGAMETLTGPIPDRKDIIGRNRRIFLPAPYISPKTPDYYSWIKTCDNRTRMECRVSVSNPQLYLAAQLGLINPASWVWEAIPFSFVVDWFGTIGEYLSSFSDFAGLLIEDPQTTQYQIWTFLEEYWHWNTTPPAYVNTIRVRYRSVYVRRIRSLTGPVIAVKPLKLPSVTRAATAVSLLVGFLKS